ncbi:MAG: hypothetical protein ACYDHY_07060 [Acidiferrobacterales bacterium]
MSNGQKKLQVNLDPQMSMEEMVKACGRVQELLKKRAEGAKTKLNRMEEKDLPGALKYLEVAKELYAFNQMMQYSAKLADEVINLRRTIVALKMAEMIENEDELPQGFTFPVADKDLPN